eukprot:UN28170
MLIWIAGTVHFVQYLLKDRAQEMARLHKLQQKIHILKEEEKIFELKHDYGYVLQKLNIGKTENKYLINHMMRIK